MSKKNLKEILIVKAFSKFETKLHQRYLNQHCTSLSYKIFYRVESTVNCGFAHT